ncbi:translation elongation factor 4 [Candidatus Hydrogenedentota bacterium]
MNTKNIRNFSIIAHIDHGKSTLADRLLEVTNTLPKRERRDQALDSMDLERERGITIKAQAVRIDYKADDGELYQLNLIDTPGHVDFSAEVTRSLRACEGALLVVDAAQGIEAQTLANAYQAVELDLAIIPVVNKIDLPSAQPEDVALQIEHVLDLPAEDAIMCSAKSGAGIHDILERIVRDVPPPPELTDGHLQAMIFDSVYDPYRGVVIYVRVVGGTIRKGMKVRFMTVGENYQVEEVGVFKPQATVTDTLETGEVGYIITGVKNIQHARVGDTVTNSENPAAEPLPGYMDSKPFVFCGLYPAASEDYETLRDALDKMQLNDCSFDFEPETSEAMGFGFRCGFLGLLHMEIIQERLEREFDLTLVTTAPSVVFSVTKANGEVIEIHNPSMMPPAGDIDIIEEPYIEASIMAPTNFMGAVYELIDKRRGQHVRMEYLDAERVMIVYHLPLAEILLDFYDKLKSVTRGYGSMDYQHIGFRRGNLVRLDLLVNEAQVDALSTIVHRDSAYQIGRTLCSKLKETIPRQMFEVAIQAAIGSRVIARETVNALRKNVTAKCYGGDITRKRKLLEKQKEGKRRMKRVGSVDIPQEAFMSVLQIKQ